MGAGIAKPFKETFPAMYQTYADACRSGKLEVGGFLPVKDRDTGRWIYNLASQDSPGADARLEAVASSLHLAINHAEDNGLTSIGLPLIGCGIGGLEWDNVREVFELLASTTEVRIVVVSFEEVSHGL